MGSRVYENIPMSQEDIEELSQPTVRERLEEMGCPASVVKSLDNSQRELLLNWLNRQ